MKRFEGSYAVCVTPFTEDGSDINYAGLKHYINWQIASGSPGLIFLGSTGEFCPFPKRNGSGSPKRR